MSKLALKKAKKINYIKTIYSIPNHQLDSFINELRGVVINRDNQRFDDERKVYKAMIDKRPGLILKCVDVADVISCVNFCRENEVLLAVRSGGHNGGGLGICDDGLVVDLSGIKYVRADTSDNTVRVGRGNLSGELDHALYPFGLAVPTGMISTKGIGGLTLGRGVGYLSKKYGLTIDNLLEADMVLADGRFVTVDEYNYPDLFWAIRGGGGNFGIVISFKFQAHPFKTVMGGPTLWPIEKIDEIMAWYNDFLNNASDELNGFIATMVIPGPPFPDHLHNKKFCGIVWCYVGDHENFDDIFAIVRAMDLLFEHVGPMPYPSIQIMFDGMMVPGMQWYWRADFFDDLTPQMSEQHLKFGSIIPTPLSQMPLSHQ